MKSEFKKRLTARFGDRALLDCSMKPYTTFAVGGVAEALVEVTDVRELQLLLQELQESDISWRIIGKGSNLLVKDEGFDGVIILLGGEFLSIDVTEDKKETIVSVGAGVTLTSLVKWCQSRGLSGTEFLFGIPGSIGGAAVMNAGAWKQELSEVVTSIEIVSLSDVTNLSVEQLEFEYRNFKTWQQYAGKAIVSKVSLSLEKEEPHLIKERCLELVERRMKTQPKGLPNAGSFFKNPTDDSAGRLIENSGLKGYRVGGAMVSDIHANFLVNSGQAKAADVIKLMKYIQEKVEKDSGVQLVPEVHFI